jgi:hypothetical protein
MRHKPFIEYNGIAALLIADAFLRKNGFKYVPKDVEGLLGDIYTWYLKEQEVSISGQFLNVIFNLKPIKKGEPVWGMVEEMKNIISNIEENMITGNMRYEKEI